MRVDPRLAEARVFSLRLALLLLLAAAPAAAQSSPDSARALGTVTVTATRLPLDTRDAPQRLTRLTPADAEAAGAVTLADLLDARAPLVVRRTGPTGLATLSLRGAGSAQTLVLLDGVPLGSPALGVVDASLVPLALVESAEVVSGASSGLWGSRAVGGVVALTSGGAPGAGAEAGAWGARRVWARSGVRAGRVEAAAAAERVTSTDDYAVPDGAGGVRAREGWDARREAALVSVGAEAGAARLRLIASGARAERGLGGVRLDGVLVGERQWDESARLVGHVGTRFGDTRLDATLGGEAARLRWAAPFPAPVGRLDAVDETGHTRAFHADLRATRPVPGGTLALGGSAGAASARHPSLPAGDARDAFAALTLAADLSRHGVRLFPSLRVDHSIAAGRAGQTAVSPSLGANVALGQGGAWRAKASAGRAFRMPTLNDRFWQPGGRADLRPERVWAADAGIVGPAGPATLEAGVFARAGRDEIVWLPASGSVWQPENVARTRAVGAEASVRGAGAVPLARRRVRAEGGTAATWLHARDATSGQPLRYQPAWTARAWTSLGVGATWLDVGLRGVGARPTTASGSLPLPTHAVVTAGVRTERTLGRARLGAGLVLDNLLGARYESVRLHPMPPRHARVRLTVSFP